MFVGVPVGGNDPVGVGVYECVFVGVLVGVLVGGIVPETDGVIVGVDVGLGPDPNMRVISNRYVVSI